MRSGAQSASDLAVHLAFCRSFLKRQTQQGKTPTLRQVIVRLPGHPADHAPIATGPRPFQVCFAIPHRPGGRYQSCFLAPNLKESLFYNSDTRKEEVTFTRAGTAV